MYVDADTVAFAIFSVEVACESITAFSIISAVAVFFLFDTFKEKKLQKNKEK